MENCDKKNTNNVFVNENKFSFEFTMLNVAQSIFRVSKEIIVTPIPIAYKNNKILGMP